MRRVLIGTVLATVLALYESAATQPLLAVTHETSEVKHA